jgi:hypothetical protein
MRRLILGFAGVGVCLLVSACGNTSDGSDGECPNGAACGGSIVGSWKITSSCVTIDLDSMMASASCPEQTSDAKNLKVTGNVTYGADLSYTSNFTLAFDVVVAQPKSCLTKQNITLTCAQLQQGVEAQLAMTAFTSVNCAAAAGGGCACTFRGASQTISNAGTYTTTGAGLLTETPTGGAPDDSDYCVKGSTLTLSPHGDANAVMNAVMMDSSTSGTITLTKQ